ncbi:MAG: YdcH family protein [Pseudomonadota bacterium]
MSNTPHELANDFPEHIARISQLRGSDAHFARLVQQYHDINRAVHRAETDIEPVSDLFMKDLRKQRMVLKDEIYGILSAA